MLINIESNPSNLLPLPKAITRTRTLRREYVSSNETHALGYLVSTPKALRILFTHKILDARVQHLLALWACTLSALIAASICGFCLVPTFWAVGALAPAIFLFALFLSIGAGDLFLKFALEDKGFFEMATKSHALSVFEDEDQSLPQPGC